MSSTSSAIEPIKHSEHLARHAIVCDVARDVIKQRSAVRILEGELVEVPEAPCCKIDSGFPEGTMYAWLAEAMTMTLTMESRLENFAIEMPLDEVNIEAIHRSGRRPGFELAEFRSFGEPVDERPWDRISIRSQSERSMRSIER